MVLTDTSVWIRFLANVDPFAEELATLLSRDEVVGHDLIHGELIIGDAGGRKELLRHYSRIQQLCPLPHADVAAFVRARKLHGRGIGWIDAHLLSSALAADVQLWTATDDWPDWRTTWESRIERVEAGRRRRTPRRYSVTGVSPR